ncbi:MAG: hypothetical protein JNM84_12480, partial [Planctomycetes bacterium]|nr:hypothetical protein [Planctomycetota bacterium]
MPRKLFGSIRALGALSAMAALSVAPRICAQGTPIGFLEEFALARDRAATLAKLIPGTEEHFYYSCLLAEHEGRFEEQARLLAQWLERHGRTPRVIEIEDRRALLLWKQDPAMTAEHLRQRLSLDFQHQRETGGVDPNLPTALDPSLYSEGTLRERALQQHPGTLDGFQDRALRALAATPLDDARLGALLERLRTPDVPNLPALVVRQLRLPQAKPFGSLAIHKLLYLEQLETCARELPNLLDDHRFIAAYLQRLRPSADEDWQRDPALRGAFLERLEAFTQRLSPSQNSLKAHVLYHRLQHDLAGGQIDAARFQSFLRLPRRTSWTHPRVTEGATRPSLLVDSNVPYGIGLAPAGDVEPLVRRICERLFVDAPDYDAYAELLNGDWVRRVFAEAKILAGVGDMQRWYALLDDPAYYEELRDRVEIRFTPTANSHFAIDEPVAFDLELKNAGTLLVRVFEIHTRNFHREQQREIDVAIDLDGLVANEERELATEPNPLRRTTQRLEFPNLDRRGTWMIELIGNGVSSRALVKKGRLGYVQRSSSAGQLVRVLDEQGRHLQDATLILSGRELSADANGEILLPWSTAPGEKAIVLCHGAFSTLETIEHAAESYALTAAIHVEAEALLPGRRAPIVVRPRLLANGVPVAVGLLEAPRLTITARDHDGIATSLDVPSFALHDDRESVHEILVPENLASLEVTLHGRVPSLTTAEPVELTSATRSLARNGIDATPLTHTALLGRSAEGYMLDLLGKDGEPKPGRAVTLHLEHRDFRDIVSTTLRTDERGRIALGALEGIVSVTTSELAKQSPPWHLSAGSETLPSALHGAVGETLRLAWPARYGELTRANAGLARLIGGHPQRDEFERMTVASGYLELRDLVEGDYALWLGEVERRIEVRVVRGPRDGGYVHGGERRLELSDELPLQILVIESNADSVRVRLSGAGREARVHVVATRYLPPENFFEDLRASSRRGPAQRWIEDALSSYHSDRAISDEHRYILDRRSATIYAGNMLRRAGLLLNPWALDEEATRMGGEGRSGEGFSAPSGPSGRPSPHPSPKSTAVAERALGAFANLAFLPAPAPLLLNLRPDAQGIVTIGRQALGEGQHLHVLALDERGDIYATLALPERALQPRTQQLARALDPAQKLAERQKIEYLAAGAEAVIPDRRVSKFETFGSLAEVHRLFRTLSANEELARFAFVLDWSELEPEEKLARYAEHACHELHFFLYRKDRTFFDAIVRPYLANKAAKTFLDEWLLEADLSRYLESRAFAELNTFERILLAQRFPAERANIARALRETLELRPPDPEQDQRLFRRVLESEALSHGFAWGDRGEIEPQGNTLGEDKFRLVDPKFQRNDASSSRAPKDAFEVVPMHEEGLAEVEESLKDVAKADLPSLSRELELRKSARGLYRAPETTQRYVESNYWKRRIEEQGAALIGPNAFWLDYALASDGARFASPHFAQASTCFAEMLLALAVLDLPLRADEPEIQIDGVQITLRPKTPVLLVRQEIAPAPAAPADAAPVLVNQSFFRLDDRYLFEGNEQREKVVREEFLSDVAYGAQVVITNPSSAPRKLELLLQIPQGALPVTRGFVTRGVSVVLQPYATQALEYAFYFPGTGERAHYPVHVASAGAIVAAAAPIMLKVVAVPSTFDTSSWAHVSQNGSSAEVLAFLSTANLQRLDLGKIAWRCRERGFHSEVLRLLRARKHYDHLLWSYAIQHRDEAGLREFLSHADRFLASCGSALEAELLTIDPVERKTYQIVEFEPLVNARAHRFGRERTILNEGVARQYLAFLDILAHRPSIGALDRLGLVYYLLLQERFEEALAHFAAIDATQLATKLQYDYLRAYLAFTTGDLATARRVAAAHREHPVARWRALFGEVLKQADEAEGKLAAAGASEDPVRQQTDLAEREPSLELAVEGSALRVRYRNIAQAQLSFFAMDVELLFSTRPFVDQAKGSFAYVKPNLSRALELPAGQSELALELPAEFRAKNVWIELTGGGLVRRTPFYANSLAVRWIESYGQVQVSDSTSSQPLPKVYVKVYAREPGGKVRFHKDGYTDLRGRFDYASISGEGA